MGRQWRWFLGALLTTFLVTIGLGLYPFVHQSSLNTSSQNSQTEIVMFGSSTAQAQAPDVVEPSIFQDPAGQYEIALLDGYQSFRVADTTVMESPDGNLAYAVVTVPKFDPGIPLTNAALAQIARETFQQGEGFITKEFQTIPDGIKVNWQGRVTTRGSQRLSGSIFARQREDLVVLLMISATEEGQERLSQVITTLPSSLQLLTP